MREKFFKPHVQQNGGGGGFLFEEYWYSISDGIVSFTSQAMHEKYSKQPAAIDWAGYKEFFGNHPTIAKLQEDYESAAGAVTLPQPEVNGKEIEIEIEIEVEIAIEIEGVYDEGGAPCPSWR